MRRVKYGDFFVNWFLSESYCLVVCESLVVFFVNLWNIMLFKMVIVKMFMYFV